ncbi:MAG: amidohydrolase family protein [Porticoccaceae bacterium]|nr:amidohydrolase family protein [Porticoccaceae bacterium]
MKSKTRILAAIFSMTSASMPFADTYDLVINNGRVMDPETMYDNIANVGIKDGRIVAITSDSLSGKQSIDATGLVVAPGFIDTHFHSVDRFATKLAVRDGVTTGMDLEAGATRVGDWYKEKETSGWQVNFGTTSSLGLNRIIVHDPEVKMDGSKDASDLGQLVASAAKDGVSGWSVTRSSIQELNQIVKLLDEDLRQGAIGVGVGAAYMQRGMTSYEQFEVQRAAARYGRLASVHTRFHINAQTPSEAPIALDEVLLNAMLLNAPLLLAHDNDYGWWENEEKLKLARAQGFNVWGEYYPFTAGSTIVSATFLSPEMWEDVNGYKYEETIYDPASDKFLSKTDYLDMVANEPGHMIVVFMPARKDWMKYWLAMPEMVVASDAMMGLNKNGELLPYDADPSEYAGHPRTGSSYSTTLKLARENGVPLMFTLAQLSYWNAKHLGDTGLVAMQERGRVQVGKIADLTLFDPNTVAPRATYKMGENGLPSAGIPWVIVNGTIVVKDSVVQDVRPGQSIRFAVESQPKYVPVNWGEWLDEHTIMPPAFHQDHLDDPRAH